MDERLQRMIKAAANTATIEDIENYLTGQGMDNAMKPWIESDFDDKKLPYGFTPNVNRFLDSKTNIPLRHSEGKVLLPRNEEGKREISTDPEKLTGDAEQGTLRIKDSEKRKEDWEAFKAALEQKRHDAMMAGALTAGSATAVASYLGLGLIPRMRRYRVIRALLGLAGGFGAGLAYKTMSNPSIYRDYDYEKIRNAINADPEIRKGLLRSMGVEDTVGQKIDSIEGPVDKNVELRKDVANAVKRYGIDTAVGAATGLGTYAATAFIPKIKKMKALRMLLAGGTGIGAGLLTDLATRKGA